MIHFLMRCYPKSLGYLTGAVVLYLSLATSGLLR